MQVYLLKNTRLKGQTLLSLLIALAIFGILAHAIFTLTSVSFRFAALSRARITARHLAQERVEIIRNLSYDQVGTLGGIPPGPITQTENIVRNGLNYLVETSIIYVDDPFDGEAPADLLSTDYKRARVEISWEGQARSGSNPIVLVTDISPRGIETTEGGGTLSIIVFNSNAQPVSQASVNIFTDSLDPVVDITQETNENGRLILPGTPVCISCYKITVTKEGYSTERTYSNLEVANPNKPYVSVIEGQLVEVGFAIDLVGELEISSLSDRDNDFSAIGNVVFRLRGQKTIGTDVNDLPIYKYDQELTTSDEGKITIEDLEWDNYDIFLPTGSSYDISGSNPLIPLSALPNINYEVELSLSSATNHRLFLVFTDSSAIPIASVSATISDTGSFEETKFSGQENNPDFGQVFFPDLEEINYEIIATASGYTNFIGNTNVSGYTKDTIILSPE